MVPLQSAGRCVAIAVIAFCTTVTILGSGGGASVAVSILAPLSLVFVHALLPGIEVSTLHCR
jgi:hypothetical protein